MVFNSNDVIYYAVMCVLTFLAGVFRTLRDRDYQRHWDIIPVGVVGSFWGLFVVSVCSYFGPSIAEFGWPYIGLSTAIGLLGKEQEKLMKVLLTKTIEKFTGLDLSEPKEQLDEPEGPAPRVDPMGIVDNSPDSERPPEPQ